MEARWYQICAYYVEAVRRKRIAAAALLFIRRRNQERKRATKRKWVREWFEKRDEGRRVLNMVHSELRLQDSDSYANYLRMDEAIFESCLRESHHVFNAKTRLCVRLSVRGKVSQVSSRTLRFLASGNTYQDLSFAVRIPANTLSLIVPDTLNAIGLELEEECIRCPGSAEGWMEVERDYKAFWNFPHCIGALDGKHINFRPLRKYGSFFRNYKGRDSTVLLALVDASYKFLFIDVGRNGRMNDGAVFRDSDLGRSLANGTLNFPPPCALLGDSSNTSVPYVLTADDAFPLSTYLMKPYPSRGLDQSQRIFNYRLSRARRVVENVFGILANRFRILLTTISLSVEKVELITRVCCILHNYILARKPIALRNVGTEEATEEIDCSLNGIGPQGAINPTQRAKAAREYFRKYFNSIGAVPWQYEAILRGNY